MPNVAYEPYEDENRVNENKANAYLNPSNNKDYKQNDLSKQEPNMAQTALEGSSATNPKAAPEKRDNATSVTHNRPNGPDQSLGSEGQRALKPRNNQTNANNIRNNTAPNSNLQENNLNTTAKQSGNIPKNDTGSNQESLSQLEQLKKKVEGIKGYAKDIKKNLRRKVLNNTEIKQVLKDIKILCNENNVNDKNFVKILENNSEENQEKYIKLFSNKADNYIKKLDDLIKHKQKKIEKSKK